MRIKGDYYKGNIKSRIFYIINNLKNLTTPVRFKPIERDKKKSIDLLLY